MTLSGSNLHLSWLNRGYGTVGGSWMRLFRKYVPQGQAKHRSQLIWAMYYHVTLDSEPSQLIPPSPSWHNLSFVFQVFWLSMNPSLIFAQSAMYIKCAHIIWGTKTGELTVRVCLHRRYEFSRFPCSDVILKYVSGYKFLHMHNHKSCN